MAPTQKLTSNSSETDLNLLLSGETVFQVPYFQRGYKWETKRIKQLTEDLLQVLDDSSTHFLGAIIIHGRPSDPSEPKIYEVIDGQQRITTIFLFLCAIAKTLCKEAQYAEASALFLKYLLINREISIVSNFKVQPSKDDREQLNAVFTDLLSDLKFKERLGDFRLKPLLSSASNRGAIHCIAPR